MVIPGRGGVSIFKRMGLSFCQETSSTAVQSRWCALIGRQAYGMKFERQRATGPTTYSGYVQSLGYHRCLMNVLQTAAFSSIIGISYYTYWHLYGSLICVGICTIYWEALGISVRLLGG